MTEHAKISFVVKQDGVGNPWIVCEPISNSLSILNKAIIGFDLPKGTTGEKAKQIAEYLDKNLESINFTKLG